MGHLGSSGGQGRWMGRWRQRIVARIYCPASLRMMIHRHSLCIVAYYVVLYYIVSYYVVFCDMKQCYVTLCNAKLCFIGLS